MVKDSEGYHVLTFGGICDRYEESTSEISFYSCWSDHRIVGRVIPISTAPAVEPAMMDLKALG